MNSEEVLTRLRNESDASIGAHDGLLSERIEKLNDYYHGKPYGNEIVGRSRFITREVYETIESIMPYLVKISLVQIKPLYLIQKMKMILNQLSKKLNMLIGFFIVTTPDLKLVTIG